MSLSDILDANPSLNLLSRSKLTTRLKSEGITKAQIDAHFKPKELNQIYAPAKRLQPLKITADPYTFQMDIALLPAYKSQNKGIDKILVLIDILSRKAYCFPLKSGSMVDVSLVVVKFYRDLITDEGVLLNGLQSDDAFNNPQFKKTCDDLGIVLVTGVAKDDHIVRGHGDKLGIVDRFCRTIKVYIQKYMLLHKDLKWTRYLDKLVDLYNDTPHTGLKGADDTTTPNEVFDDYDFASAMHKGQQASNRKVGRGFDIHVGDTVRILMGKQVFDKEKPRFSTDLYHVVSQQGYRFQLMDEAKHDVKRLYRPSEMFKVESAPQDRVGSGKKTVVEAVSKHQGTLRVLKGTAGPLGPKTYDDARKLQDKVAKIQVIAPIRERSTRQRKGIAKLDL